MKAIQSLVLSLGLILLGGCGTSDAPPSPQLLGRIQNAIGVPAPEIHRNSRDIPVVVFGNGAKVTIGMEDPATIGSCVFISDLTDPLRFEGAADRTLYRGGRGVVVLEGKKVYLYHLTVADTQLTAEHEVKASAVTKDTPTAIREQGQAAESPITCFGRITAVQTAQEVTGVLGMPGKWRLGPGPFLQASVAPKDGRTWLVVIFEEREKELAFDLSDLKLTLVDGSEPIACWSVSPDRGKHYVFDATKMAPVEKGKVEGEALVPAAAFEVPANVHSGTLTVKGVEVPLRW